MPGIFSPDNIPEWMNPTQQILRSGAETSQEVSRNFLSSFMQAKENNSTLAKLKSADMLQNLEINKWKLGQMQSEQQQWSRDAPNLIPWLSASPEKRAEMPVPEVSSDKAIGLVSNTEQRDDVYFLRRQTSTLAREQYKEKVNWQSALGSLDPQTRAFIKQLPNGGMLQDGTPSSEAIGLYNQWAAKNNKPAYGSSPSAVAAFYGSQRDVQKEQAAQSLEATRQKNRIELANIRASLSDRGVQESFGHFYDRHWNSVFNKIMGSTNPNTGENYTAQEAKDESYKILQDAYSQAMPEKQSSATAPQSPPNVGEVRDGYEFLGGDPADPNSWLKLNR